MTNTQDQDTTSEKTGVDTVVNEDFRARRTQRLGVLARSCVSPVNVKSYFLILLVIMLGLSFFACSSSIGDSCSTNIDCSPLGDRVCDTAQREGYCTIKGCGVGSCPDEAVCVRFFPASFLTVSCDPKTEDAVDPSVTPTNYCSNDEVCLQSGVCALRSLERRFCMKQCERNEDCREGFECRSTGSGGAEPVFDPERKAYEQFKFCVETP